MGRMTHLVSTTVWPSHASLIRAAGSRNRDLFPLLYPPPGNHGRPSASASPHCPRIPPGVRRLIPLLTLLKHHYTPIIARMCFPRGAGWLKIPYAVAPRFRSTVLLWRLRATTTLLRSAYER
jgi:hypothetical protein